MTTNIKNNPVYQEIQARTNKLIAIRKKAQNIVNYATAGFADCSYVSCFDCPMNVGIREIVCLVCVEVRR